MKKIFTASALAAVALSAAAFTAPKMPDVKISLTPERAEMLKAKLADDIRAMEDPSNTSVYRRTYTDASGDVWTLSLTNNGTDYWTMFWDPEDPDGKVGYDYYKENWTCAPISVRNNSAAEGKDTYMSYLAFWPTNILIRNSTGFPEPAADAKDEDPYSVELAIQTGLPFQVLEEMHLGFYTEGSGSNAPIKAFGIWNTGSMLGTGQNPNDKKPFYEYAGYESCYNGIICTPETGSVVTINEFDKALSYVNVNFDANFVKTDGSRVGSIVLDYDGEGYVDGFEVITKTWKVGECHVVDTGLMSYDIMSEKYEWTLYGDDWGPLHRYYLMMCGEGLTWPAGSFEKNSYPSFRSSGSDGPWLAEEGKVVPFNFIRGALYAPADAKDFNQTYVLYRPGVKEQYGMVDVTPAPTAKSCLYSGYNTSMVEYVNIDGMRMGYNGYYSVWQPGAKVCMGTPQGIVIKGVDSFNDIIDFVYDGKIIFHNDPNDFTVTTEIDSKGTNNEGVSVDEVSAVKGAMRAVNGEITVTVNEAAPVVIYGVNGVAVAQRELAAGETMTVSTGNGIFIVKIADKATKVIL